MDDVIRAEADELWELLRSIGDGGHGAYAYVCGSARFAVSVLQALTGIVPCDGREFLRGLVHDDLRTLWQLTAGFCDPHLDIRSLYTDLAAMSARPDTGLVRDSVSAVRRLLLAGDDFGRVTAMCRVYTHGDVRLPRDLKSAVLEGVRAFEIHEADVVERAGATLLTAAGDALAAVSAYYRRLAEQTRGQGVSANGAGEETIPDDRGMPGHGGPLPLPD
ncbi:hypothetical protein AB0C10_22480 [Microbispora amethystogenes]|uniref:hypothetical protein n=1 Tax=Microbispora amethystogenes TaxID=1427754 RepID=UPI00340FCC1E